MIGVNSAIFSPTGGNVGIGFAVPANVAGPVIESLRTGGRVERGWLGVAIQQVDETLAEALGLDEAKGALVASVIADGPAARAGLRPGDVIVSFAGRPIDAMKDLPRIVAELDSGTEAEIGIRRDGRRETLTATVGVQAQEGASLATAPAADDGGDAPRLGVALAARGEPGKAGVSITGVVPGSPAARAGTAPRRRHRARGSRAVSGPGEVAGAVARRRPATSPCCCSSSATTTGVTWRSTSTAAERREAGGAKTLRR